MWHIGWATPSLRPESDLRLIPRQAFGGYLSEGRSRAVLLGEHGCVRGPLYPDLRIVPEHGGLGLRIVLRRALVGEERRRRGDEKAVSEALGDIELALVLRGEGDGRPLAEGR